MKILICTDGSESSIQSAELVSNLGFPRDTEVTILGVSENPNESAKISGSMEKILLKLNKSYHVDKKIRNGDAIEEILSEAVESSTDLVAVGGGKKQLNLLHPALGSTTSKLTRKLHTHFLVARRTSGKISKVLFCAGADAPSSRSIKFGGTWISNTSAKVNVLHVVAKEKQGNLGGDTIVQNAAQKLRAAGVTGEIKTSVRRGLVVEEVVSELNEKDYDLLVVGAHYQPGQDRWQGTLLDDITDQLLNRSLCSVLII